jgi:N-acetylglutamate synthase-like GNAT family acetyltransferase
MNNLIATITNSIVIEEAKLTDIEGIKDLLIQLVPDQNPEYGLMLVDLSESIKSDNNKWFVIRHNDNVVGCCQLLMYSNLIRSPYQKAVIDSVIIDERHQYLGYGQLLIEKVLEYANQQNVGKVQLISSFPRIQAHSFYEKMNFKKVGYGFILDLNNRTVNYY